jgi:hypothetical protein
MESEHIEKPSDKPRPPFPGAARDEERRVEQAGDLERSESDQRHAELVTDGNKEAGDSRTCSNCGAGCSGCRSTWRKPHKIVRGRGLARP